MSDLFGHAQPAAPFKDIRNQQATAAEEKAVLCNQLRVLIQKVPQNVANGSIQRTRQWMHDQQRAVKVMRNQRSSRVDLSVMVATMRAYEQAEAA